MREQDTHCQKLRLQTPLDTESEYAVIDDLWSYVREDPDRMRFPIYNGNVSIRALSDIKKIRELGDGVHLVYVDTVEYVYKELDRPNYVPRDSEVLETELRNLEQMHGSEGVVRLIAVVVSDNPYRTTAAIGPSHQFTRDPSRVPSKRHIAKRITITETQLSLASLGLTDHSHTSFPPSEWHNAYGFKAKEYRPQQEQRCYTDRSQWDWRRNKWCRPIQNYHLF